MGGFSSSAFSVVAFSAAAFLIDVPQDVTKTLEGGAVVKTHHHASAKDILEWYDADSKRKAEARIKAIHADDEEILLILTQAVGGLYG